MNKISYLLLCLCLLFLCGCSIDLSTPKEKEPNNTETTEQTEDDIEKEPSKPVKTDNKILVAYYYGGYQIPTKEALEVLDVINTCFASISKRTTDDGETEYYLNVSGISGLQYFKNLHQYGLKVCISIGGWHDDASYWNTYSEAASTEEYRKMVAKSCLAILEQYDLDGIDMDWEYPKAGDKDNFTLLMKEISDTLKAKRSDYLITAAVPSGSWSNTRYDYNRLGNILDYLYVMTYDLDLDGGSKTRHLADIKTMKSACQNLITCGVASSKIIPGAAFYGRIYKVSSSTNHGLGQTYDSSLTKTVHYEYIKYYYLDNLGTGIGKYYDASSEAYYLYAEEKGEFITFDSEESVQTD